MALREFFAVIIPEDLPPEVDNAKVEPDPPLNLTWALDGAALNPTTGKTGTVDFNVDGVSIGSGEATATPTGTNLDAVLGTISAGITGVIINDVSQFVTARFTHTASGKTVDINFFVIDFSGGGGGSGK